MLVFFLFFTSYTVYGIIHYIVAEVTYGYSIEKRGT